MVPKDRLERCYLAVVRELDSVLLYDGQRGQVGASVCQGQRLGEEKAEQYQAYEHVARKRAEVVSVSRAIYLSFILRHRGCGH